MWSSSYCLQLRYNSHYRVEFEVSKCFVVVDQYIPYILNSNPHPFYSFRGLKIQMQIRIAWGLDSRSWAWFWKNDRAAVRAVRTIQYNNLLFIIFIIYYSSDSLSSLITESLSITRSLSSLSSPSFSHKMSSSDPSKALLMQWITVKALVTSSIIQSVCLVGKGRLKDRCRLEPWTNFLFRLKNRQKLVRIRFGCGLDSRIYGIIL